MLESGILPIRSYFGQDCYSPGCSRRFEASLQDQLLTPTPAMDKSYANLVTGIAGNL